MRASLSCARSSGQPSRPAEGKKAGHRIRGPDMSAVINKLKSLPPLEQQVCGTCQFYRLDRMMLTLSGCKAMSTYADMAWPKCQGRYWQPPKPHIPVFQRLKRWLIG